MAGLIDRVGIDEALKVVETEQEAEFGTVLLVEWLTKYVNSLTGVQDDGRRKYLAYIRNDIIPFFGERAPLDAVTQDTDAALIVYLQQDKGNAPKTISDKHAILSAALRAAVEQRPVPLLPYNPCAGMRLPRHDWAEIDIFDNDEWELFEQLLLARRDLRLLRNKALWRGADPDDLLAGYGPGIRTLSGKVLTPYTLRHTGISWKLQDGVPIFVVSRDAGHESVNTTDRYYGHNDRKASESAAQVIAGRLPRVRASMLRIAA